MNASVRDGNVDRSVVDAAVPTAAEIKKLKVQANLDKERSATGDHLSATRVRQSVSVGTMRYVWAISLILAVLAMILAYGLTIH